jgi:hypothetical protein
MKKSIQLLISAIAMVAILMLAPSGNGAFAQKTKATMKIGTYDSRIVTFAWSRSDYFKQHMIKFNKQNDSAEKAHDTARVKELSVGIMSYQHLLHQMVFSNGSIGIVMAIVKDKLPELAKTAGVSVIISKWELNFSDPSIEIIDLTSQVAQLFHPKENIDKMVGEISQQPPVPIDELGIESDMLDLYCQKFGKK